MKSIKICLILLGIVFGFASCESANQEVETSNSTILSEKNSDPSVLGPKSIEGKFAHIVLFWLKEPENKAIADKFKDELNKFISSSKHGKSMHIGQPANTDRPVVDRSYTFCLIITFDSKEEHDLYQVDPDHLNFVEQNNEKWDRVQIYDSVMPI